MSTPTPANSKGLDLGKPEAWGEPAGSTTVGSLSDDDDPFGLGQMETATNCAHSGLDVRGG